MASVSDSSEPLQSEGRPEVDECVEGGTTGFRKQPPLGGRTDTPHESLPISSETTPHRDAPVPLTTPSLGRSYAPPPTEIARIVASLAPLPPERHLEQIREDILLSLALQPSEGGLAVTLLEDGIACNRETLEEIARSTRRALDGILLQLLEERGRWDERISGWILTASSDIRLILGLATEYPNVTNRLTGSPIVVSREPIDATLILAWSELGLDLSMEWLNPDGSTHPWGCSIIGSDPYWILIDSTIFPVSEIGSRIANLFAHGSHVWLPRYQVGPILEGLPASSPFVRIVGASQQPTVEVCQPRPILSIILRSAGSDHFFSNEQLELSASLEFDYPSPPAERNVVYLPDRQFEESAVKVLLLDGFQQRADGRRFFLQGDDVLDFLRYSHQNLPEHWLIQGIQEAASQIRFADLSVSVSLSAAQEKASVPTNWFDCNVTLKQNNADVPLSTLFKRPLADTARWVRLDSGAFAPIPAGSLLQLKSMLGLVDPNFKLSGTLKTKINAAQALSLSAAPGPFCSMVLDERIVQMRRRLENADGLPQGTPNKHFKGKLRSYQSEGLGWISFLHECSLAGILADEMGLGKTVQTLAFLQNTHREAGKPISPSLIIAPTSVTTNWLYEAKRFAPDLRVMVLQGPQRKRLFSSIPSYDVVITSYALLRLDRHELSQYQFSVLVLDEAQNIKNPTAATTKAAKGLKAHARLALSGTPTENRPLELWSIMDFLMPGYLGTSEFFKNYFEKPILEEGIGGKVGEILKAKIRPFILRRTKNEVEKDLPPKIESVLHVEMTHSQRELYSQILEEVRPKVFDAIEKRGVSGATVSILTALLRLRQVCNHPNSIGALRSIEGFDSGKFNLFKELVLEALESNRKILVFSQFKEMLSIMQSWIDELTIPYLYLDGSTKDRQNLVDAFNTDPSIRLFLISLKAGGTGLNLTAADTVIIYDPWWNPAVESQAVDRAHRIGQVKTVNVYRLVTEHSVEQRIMELKRKKAHLVDALVNENGTSPLSLTSRELELLFESPLHDAVEIQKK